MRRQDEAPRPRRDLFMALGRFCYHRRWLVVAIWLVLFAGGIAVTPQLGHVLQGGGFENPGAPGQLAANEIQARLGQGSATLVIVFQGDGLKAKSAAFQKQERQILTNLEAAGIPGLQSIQTYAGTGAAQLISKDGKSSVAVLTFDTSRQEVQQEVDGIRAVLRSAERSTQLTTSLTGEPAVYADLTSASLSDLGKVELYALPVALLALVVVFGTVVAAALPVITGGMAVSVTLGGLYLLGHVTDMSIFCMNVASLLGLAVAIDYALFIVARFREELHGGKPVEEAVVQAAARAGRSVFYSGVAVIVGLAGLMFFPSAGMRSVSIGGVLVVFLSVAASLTFMPALLGLLGRRVDSLRVVPLRPPHESRFWTGWARVLLRRPWAVLVVSLALAALVASPALDMTGRMASAASLPASSEARAGAEILTSEFDQNQLSPLSVLVTADTGDGSIDLAKAVRLYSFGQALAQTPGVASVISPFTMEGLSDPAALATFWPAFKGYLNDPSSIPDARIELASGVTIPRKQVAQLKQLLKGSIGEGAVLFRVVAEAAPTSQEARDLVGTIEGLDAPSGMSVQVAGTPVNDRDFAHDNDSTLPWIVLWIAVSSYLILFFLLRSVLLPLLAVAVNWLTILMSWGCLAFIFQRDTFAGLLHFTSTGATDSTVPILILCLLFGVTMDYAVFLLTRMREAWQETGVDRRSVGIGLVSTGRVVLSAALLVVVVFGAFAFTGVSTTKMLGVGMALAVIFDALFIRMALLPSAMCYLGKACWWSPRLRRKESKGAVRAPGSAPAHGLAQDQADV
jgi:putative drug exporter of the RND superfamily